MADKAKGGNPAFNMMGLPRIHTWKMPSRNWSIFWGVVASFGGMLAYDRYEKKKVLEKYKKRVCHLADEPLQPLQMPRRVMVYMSAPPGDGIWAVREPFVEYVKPILNAAAIDYKVIEGVRQGELRQKVAQEIRDARGGVDNLSDLQRDALSKVERSQDGGTIVFGRQSFKEYIRGLHEGWLGPLQPPQIEVPAIDTQGLGSETLTTTGQESSPSDSPTTKDIAEVTPVTMDTLSTMNDTAEEEKEKKKKEEEEKKKPKDIAPPYIAIAQYSEAPDPTIEQDIQQTYIPLQHLLGVLNTPWRLVRFLNRRELAERMCAATAAIVLDQQTRPWQDTDVNTGVEEEADWAKEARKIPDGIWMEEMAVDRRLTNRIYIHQLPNEDVRQPEVSQE